MAEIEVRASGTKIEASRSDRIVVRVRENATTGYQWSVTQLDPSLVLESNELVLPERMLAGAGGERVIVIRPSEPGRARLSLQLKRQWEAEPVERFELEVAVE